MPSFEPDKKIKVNGFKCARWEPFICNNTNGNFLQVIYNDEFLHPIPMLYLVCSKCGMHWAAETTAEFIKTIKAL